MSLSKILKTNNLYNHVIHSIDIEFHVGSVVAVPKTQLSLLQVYVIQDMWLNYNWTKTLFHFNKQVSIWLESVPMEALAASMISLALSSSLVISINSGKESADKVDLSFTNFDTRAYI